MIRARADNLVFATALMSSLVYLAASGDMLVMILAIAGIIGGRMLTGSVGGGKSLPTGTISIAVLGVLGAVVAAALSKGFDIELFSRLIAMLLTLKAYERRSSRDLSQIMLLSVFLTIGALLSDSGLLVGLGLVVLIPLVTASSMSLQLLHASEVCTDHAPKLSAAGRRSFRRTVSLLSGLGFFGALMVFLVIPRGLAQRAFGNWGEVALGNSTVGFDDEINLDIEGLISDSQTPVLDLQVLDKDGQQLGAHGKHFYLRGAVLDVYEHRKWKSTPTMQSTLVDRYIANQNYPVTTNSRTPRSEWAYQQHILIRNVEPNNAYVFGSWEPIGIAFDQTTSMSSRRDVGTAKIESARGKIGYTLRISDPLALEKYSADAKRVRPSVAIYFENQAVRAYATDLLDSAQIPASPENRRILDDRRAAQVFESNLREQFGYTLAPNAPPADTDPIEWFLLQERAGHCEYFASAMAAMCRSVGIHARIVTGYVATEYNEFTGYYLVRESNAHAWVEVQVVPGAGVQIPGADMGIWVTFDPTPPAELQQIHEPKSNLLARAQQLFETAEFVWINAVVGFGADSQRAVVGSVRLPDWFQQLDRRAEDRILSGGPRVVLKAMAIGLAAFAGCLSLLTIIKLFWANLAQRIGWPGIRWKLSIPISWRRHPRATPIEKHYSKLLHTLAQRGIPKPRSTPLERHLHESGDALTTEQRHAFFIATRFLYRAKFSSDGLTQDQQVSLAQAVREAVAKPNKSDNPRADRSS